MDIFYSFTLLHIRKCKISNHNICFVSFPLFLLLDIKLVNDPLTEGVWALLWLGGGCMDYKGRVMTRGGTQVVK